MNRRRMPFVRHSLQWNYLKLVALAMLTPTLLITACLYYLIWQTVAYELAIPELIVHALFPAFHHVNQILLIGMPTVFGLILLSAIRMTHQLAGPIYRIERELEIMVQKNDFSKPLCIRPRDQFHPLVAKINRAIRKAREQKH